MERPTRRKKNSTKINLVISAIFHSLIFIAIVFFAAREGLIGNKLKAFAVVLVPKEKKPEQPKPVENKPEPVKVETPKLAAAPKSTPPPQAASAPPPSTVVPSAAPPASALPSFSFSDGAKIVETSSDPVVLYKSAVENALRARWIRPDGLNDSTYVAELELTIDSSGRITGKDLKKSSGDSRWDEAVRKAVSQVTALNRPPPRNFPGKFTVRFDVQSDATEPLN